MKRLVKVRPRHRDEVLDAPRNRPPHAMQQTQQSVAIANGIADHANRKQIVDLIYGDLLRLELLLDRVEPLDARLHPALDVVFFELRLYLTDDLVQEALALAA